MSSKKGKKKAKAKAPVPVQHDDSEEELKQEQEQEQPPLEVKSSAPPPIRIAGLFHVLPYLYIGDANAATKSAALHEQGIKIIINCCKEQVDEFFPEEFTYYSYDIDERDPEISQYFEPIYEIIAKVRDSQGGDPIRVLVHDTTAREQAAAIVLAYMLKSAHEKKKKLTLDQAFKYLCTKKHDIQPHDMLLSQLIELETALYGEPSVRLRVQGRKKKPTKK